MTNEEIVTWLSPCGRCPSQLFVMQHKYQNGQQTGKTVWAAGRNRDEHPTECAYKELVYYCGPTEYRTKKQSRLNRSHAEEMGCMTPAPEKVAGSVAYSPGRKSFRKILPKKTTKNSCGFKRGTNGEIGIPLSCGEQSEETYRRWFGKRGPTALSAVHGQNPHRKRDTKDCTPTMRCAPIRPKRLKKSP